MSSPPADLAPRSHPSRTLTPTELEFFDHNGFLSLAAITTADELVWMREVYDRLFAEPGPQIDLAGEQRDGRATLPQIPFPSRRAPELAASQFVANARSIAAQVLGDDLEPDYREHMIYKPAQVSPTEFSPATPWHQDQGYHDQGLTYRNINFWMPLDDVTIDGGCMQFVAGSHRRGLLPHHHINHDERVHGMEVDDPERFAEVAVACPVPAGGCTMHAAYMLHYTGPNHSAQPRRAYVLVFRARPAARQS